MRKHGGLNKCHCPCNPGLGLGGLFFATCRPGQFLLREGEENLPRLWKAIQKELEQALEPHFLRAHLPWAISLWTPLMGRLRNSG